MIDDELAADLLSFGRPVLALGDPAQLPPVRGAGSLAGERPDVMLTGVHRQGRSSPVLALATQVRHGKPLQAGVHGASKALGMDAITPEEPVAADRILLGTNAMRSALTTHVRGPEGRAGPLPEVGERLVCRRNDATRGASSTARSAGSSRCSNSRASTRAIPGSACGWPARTHPTRSP